MKNFFIGGGFAIFMIVMCIIGYHRLYPPGRVTIYIRDVSNRCVKLEYKRSRLEMTYVLTDDGTPKTETCP